MIPENTFPQGFSVEQLIEFLSHNPPWWVFVVAALVPISLLYITRETLCWFYKVNAVLNSMKRIEILLSELGKMQLDLARQQQSSTLSETLKEDEKFTLK